MCVWGGWLADTYLLPLSIIWELRFTFLSTLLLPERGRGVKGGYTVLGLSSVSDEA
jgi:hypothetical protein